MILELCQKKSLMELHKRRQAITEPELDSCTPDVVGMSVLPARQQDPRFKLGNVFFSTMPKEIKIGDFGLATKVDYDGEKKKLCAELQIIAPCIGQERYS